MQISGCSVERAVNFKLQQAENSRVHPDDMRQQVRAARRGDVDAFGELMKAYENRVFRLAYSILKDREDAEDVLQITFLKALRNLRFFKGKSSFATWISRIAINESLLVLRKRRRSRTIALDVTNAMLGVRDHRPDPEHVCSRTELWSMMQCAIGQLRPTMKTVLILRDLQGLSIKETAQVTGLPVANVKTRLFRAKRALRSQLTARGISGPDPRP